MSSLPVVFRTLRSAMPLGVLLASVAGCPGQTNIQQVTQHLQVQPVAGDTYSGFTGTTLGQAVPAGKKIYLREATVTSSSGEFSWISSMTGTSPASGGDAGHLLLSKASFAGASATTDLDIHDNGDLHGLYPDGQNIRVYWAWDYTTDPAKTYPNGVTLTFTYTLDIE